MALEHQPLHRKPDPVPAGGFLSKKKMGTHDICRVILSNLKVTRDPEAAQRQVQVAVSRWYVPWCWEIASPACLWLYGPLTASLQVAD